MQAITLASTALVYCWTGRLTGWDRSVLAFRRKKVPAMPPELLSQALP
jgi:hypothetical protein